MTDPADSLALLLGRALRYLDRMEYPPAPPHLPWSVWRRTVAGRP